MEVKGYNICRSIISQIPSLELFNEKIIHNKVHFNKFNFFRIIPKGSKGFLVFKKDRTQNYCYFIEINKNMKIKSKLHINYKHYNNRIGVQRIISFNCCFDDILCCGNGTILYGTLASTNSNINYFVNEQIMYYKGNKIKFNSWTDIFNKSYECIYKHIKNISFNKNSLLISNVITRHIQESRDHNNLIYDIYCIQYINNHNDIIYCKREYSERKTYMYVKAAIKSDVYQLFDSNNKFVNICNIPDYKTSVFMNNIFRNIKENRNIDTIEESDDEDEFENISNDKFVDLERKEVFECVYNNKFNMWVPIKHISKENMKKNKYLIYKIKY